MYKVVSLMKRREGSTLEELKSYYERHHARIGELLFPGRALRYVRRYFEPIFHPAEPGLSHEPEFDMMMEMWFEDEASFQRTMAIFTDPELSRYVVEDEAHLFDRDKIRIYAVVEEETDLNALPMLELQAAKAGLGC